MKTLPYKFYNRPALEVAPELLAKVLVHKLNGEILSGRIIEVEAYLADLDEAAHSFKGETKRTKSLFTKPGIAYIYSIHQQVCLDVVCKDHTSVLVRALLSIDGRETMKKLRNKERDIDLTSGPGKLTQALGITKDLDGVDLTSKDSGLYILESNTIPKEIVRSKRIGISKAKDLDYRFYIDYGNEYLSKKR